VKYNKTATFLFPLLEIPKELFTCNVKNSLGKSIITGRFINAYLEDADIKDYKENHLFLLINNYQDSKFENFYSTMTAFPNYVDDYEKHGHLIIIYKIPEEFLIDYKLLLNGSYSKISAKAKKLILANHFFCGKAFTLPLILNKSIALKDSWEERLSTENSPVNLYDQEVWPILEKNMEILNFNIIKDLNTKNNKLKYMGEFE